MKLATSQQNYTKYVMKPNFKDGYPISQEYFAIDMGTNRDKDKFTVYLGQAILDLSNTLVYEFHYDYMQPKYESKVKLCL